MATKTDTHSSESSPTSCTTSATSSGSIDREFADSTTLHGISRVFNATRVLARLIWIAILLTCLAVCVWQITDRFKRFFMYNSNTAISVEFVKDLPFPAVTVCNFNRYRKDEITMNDAKFLRYIISANDYDYDSFGDSYDQLSYFWDDEGPGNDSSNFNYTEFTLRAGFLMDSDSLLACQWRGKANSCSSENFTHVFTSFGNCWTFNAGNIGPIMKQTQAGSGNGIQMWIDVQQSQYSETIHGNLEAGLKVLIHDQKTPPLVEAQGLAVSPGVHAFIATRKLEYENLEHPYGKCDRSKKLTLFDDYTLEGCKIECRTKAILKECGCRLVRYPGNEVECSPYQTSMCAKGVLGAINRNEANVTCMCPIPCNYNTFANTLSTALIPNDAVSEDLIRQLEDGENFTVDVEYVRNNWVLLDVYFEEINFQKFVQSEAITASALISDIGGQLGLFLGASLITLAEILTYIGLKIEILIKRHTKKSKHENSPDYDLPLK